MSQLLPNNATWDPLDTNISTTLQPKGSGGLITASNISNTSWTMPNDYAIQGKMYSVEYAVMDLSSAQFNADDIKRHLVSKLVDELFATNAIEFTKAMDAIQMRSVYRARIYAVPDTMVRILRENGK